LHAEPNRAARAPGRVAAGLLRVAERAEDLPNGYRYRFGPGVDTLMTIARVIDAERQCCRFFQFRLTIEPANGPFWLDVTGPDGTREFLADLVAER
jgi:hypothetical protein